MQMEKLTKKEKKELRKFDFQVALEKEQKQKLFKQIGIWLGVTAIIIISVFGLIKLADTGSSLVGEAVNVPKVTDKDITFGNKNSKAILIEYADFQCPACAYYHPILKQLLADFDGKILFVYRFYPIPSHKNGMTSSQAAYSAHLQNKFWEMHDMIFENQKTWAESGDADKIFLSYAEKLKLDIQKYNNDYNTDLTKKFITDEASGGISIGVNSTPTFFLNNKQIKPKGYEEFKTLIQDELK